METLDIKKLADISHIETDEKEVSKTKEDLSSVLDYLEQIKEVDLLFPDSQKPKEKYFLTNVTREDLVTNKKGSQSKEILENAPETKDGFIKVKKIL